MSIIVPADAPITEGDLVGPCTTWEPIWCCDISGAPATITGASLEAATEVLWAATGRQFGQCDVTLRPCRRDCAVPPTDWNYWGGTWPTPYLHGGLWFNAGCGSCGDYCSCTELSEVLLPGPVAEILEVIVDGTSLPVTGSYALYDDHILVRTDGDRWPACNDLSKTDGPGTWSIRVRVGNPVPRMGQLAVGELACELIAACTGSQVCRLPSWFVTSISRQGVTKQFATLSELLEHGMIGLPLVDTFIRAVNPHRLQGRSRVWSPDVARARRET